MDASYVDLGDPTHLEFDYMRWLRIVLRTVRARSVLHIGGGACALARALAAEDPGGRQEVCEADAEVLRVARAHLGLRRAPGLRVRHSEGRAFLSAHPGQTWDAIVVDAFTGAVVPRGLVTTEATHALARATPLALVNVVDDRAWREVLLIAAALADAFPLVWTLGARAGNMLVAGCRAAPDLQRIAAAAAADLAPARVTGPEATASRVAGVIPLRDRSLGANDGASPVQSGE